MKGCLPLRHYSAEFEDKILCRKTRSHGEETTMSKDPVTAPKPEQTPPLRPLALKAVVAAALMLKPKKVLKPAG